MLSSALTGFSLHARLLWSRVIKFSSMAIRLESPDSSLQEIDTFDDLPWQRASRRTSKIRDFLGTGAGYVIICTALIWTVAYIF